MQIIAKGSNLKFFEVLSSKTRLEIIEMLSTKEMNIKEISERLSISSSIVTRHISLMEEIGFLETDFVPALRGRQKICRLKEKSIRVIFDTEHRTKDYKTVVPIGSYSQALDIKAPCGIANKNGAIGVSDDPRYFLIPDRYSLEKVWYSQGVLKYSINELDFVNISSLKLKMLLSMNSHNSICEHGNVFFGICNIKVCDCELKVSKGAHVVTLEFSRNGVYFNDEKISDFDIKEIATDKKKFSFEIGVAYSSNKPAVMNLCTNDIIPGIKVEAIVDL